ncbi:membrane associated rhomboid family serine protease [Bradymonas sediminis]|uniref:Peptidase S54 rhomboid domain-containing protein n=2 Tax=Bradymonas sediminis TaxID=1548548 RepID=A0A2Z4FJT8_9DELT|nr:hypothetical protein DN745_06435 [Bradymonas sediminis]TDP72009.1 membrane associated rhomboid family serine protease [Bradymonas sediminis]
MNEPDNRMHPDPSPDELGAQEDRHELADFSLRSAAETYEQIALAPPTFLSRRMRGIGAALLGTMLWFHETILATLTSPDTPTDMLLMVLAPPCAYVLWILWRAWDTPKTPRIIVFGAEEVELPLNPNTKRSASVNYGDLHAILSLSRPKSNAVLIDTGELTLGYEDADFAKAHHPDASGKLSGELNRRILALPNHQAVLDRMRTRHEVAMAATKTPTPVTRAILAILGGYFALEVLSGALTEPFGLLRLGANAPALIEAGQYWRLISANFLHGGWVHLFFNGMALYFLGMMVEKLLGSWRFLLIYMTSAIAGAVGSWVLGEAALSVGSSTAIFGLFGAFLAIHLRYWSQLPPPFRQSKKWWGFIIVVNGGLPFLVPAIDSAAHVAGLISGLLITLAMLKAAPVLAPNRAASKLVTTLAGAVSALTVAGLVFAGIYAFDPHPNDAEKVFARLYEQAVGAENAPEQINEISWMIAIDPKSERSRVLMARDALSEITDRETGRVELRDTLATLEYRLARLSSGEARVEAIDRAVALEIALLNSSKHDQTDPSLRVFFGAQLARFLRYRHVINQPNDPLGILENDVQVTLDEDKKLIEFENLGHVREDIAVYLLVRSDDELLGMLRGCLLRGSYEFANPSYGLASIYRGIGAGARLTFEPALIRKAPACRVDIEEHEARVPEFWPLTQEVKELP